MGNDNRAEILKKYNIASSSNIESSSQLTQKKGDNRAEIWQKYSTGLVTPEVVSQPRNQTNTPPTPQVEPTNSYTQQANAEPYQDQFSRKRASLDEEAKTLNARIAELSRIPQYDENGNQIKSAEQIAEQTAAENRLKEIEAERADSYSYGQKIRRAELEKQQKAAMDKLSALETESAWAINPDLEADVRKRKEEAQAELDKIRKELNSLDATKVQYAAPERIENATKGSGKTTAAKLGNAVWFLADAFGQSQAMQTTPEDVFFAKAAGLDLEEYAQNKQDNWNNAENQAFIEKGYDTLSELNKSGEEDIARATQNTSGAGRLAINTYVAGTQLAGDMVANAVLPGSGSAMMAARAFGGGAMEARDAGATKAEQLAYGSATAAVSWGLEKIVDVAGTYGPGVGDDVVESIVAKLAQTDKGRTIARLIANAAAEGGEEYAETLIEPLLKAIYDKGEAAALAYGSPEAIANTLSAGLESFLIGTLLGAGGGGIEIATGSAAAKNTDLRLKELEAVLVPQNASNTQGDIQTPPTTAETSVAQSGELNSQDMDGVRADMPAPPAEASTAPRSKTAEEYDAETEELFEMLLARGKPPASNRVKPNNGIDSVEVMTGIPATANQEMQQPSAPQIQQGAKPQTANTAVDANGGEYVPTQTNSSDPLYTEEERTVEGLRPEDSVHLLHTDKAVDAEAERRYQANKEGEKADLFAGERTWNDADTRLAYKFLSEAVDEARKTGDYSEVVKLQREWERQGTLEGQALRQRGRFTNSPEEIIAEAATKLEDSPGGTRKLSPQRKTEIMNQVADFAKRYNDIETGDTASVVDMIKELNVVRKTTGLLSNKTSKQLSKALEQVSTYSDGDTFLRDVLATQIRSVASDYVAPSRIEQAKQVRFANLLSKLTTLARNFVGNNILDAMEMLSNNQGVALDMLLSKYTGTRSVAVDKGWLSEAKRKGAAEGYTKSFIQVALDANIDDVNTKYEQRKGRTFKMTGNPLERFMSTWEKHLAYGLQTSDEMQKGGIRAEAQRGIDELKAKGKIADDALADRAEDIALERTLQNDSMVARAVAGVRRGLDEIAISDKQGGKLGAGELLVPFARVPANATVKLAQYSPAGILEGGARLGKVLLDAHNGTLTPDQQAKAVQSLGRTMTATELTILSTTLALKGIIKSEDDEDKDEKAADRARGQRGTQLNLSALMRWISGNGSADWQDSDVLMDVGFAEQLNGVLTMGVALADAYQEDGTLSTKDIVGANAAAVVDAVSELPALSNFANIADSINYSDADDTVGKVADAAMGFGVETVGSFVVPNAVRGIATGTDKYERDSYGGDSAWEQQMNYIKSGIPGLRQTLPKTVDSTGRETSYEDEPVLHFLNNNILPGRITKYENVEYLDEIDRLMDIGANANAGVGSLYPDRKAPNTVNLGGDNKKYELSEEEKREYQAARAQTNEEILNELIASKVYEGMSDEVKALAVDAAWDFATYSANRDLAGSKGITYSSNLNYIANLREPAEYIAANTAYKIASDKKDYSGIDAILDAWDTFDRTTKDTLLKQTDIDDFALAAEGGVPSKTYASVKTKASNSSGDVSQDRLYNALDGLDDNTADVLWEIWRDKYNWKKSWDEYKRSKK